MVINTDSHPQMPEAASQQEVEFIRLTMWS